MLDAKHQLTKQAIRMQIDNQPRSTVILAAGFGLRMVPASLDKPKGLLTVKGEALIERIIRQLKDAKVFDMDRQHFYG